MSYTITACGSHPDSDNDDCFYGESCESFLQLLDLFGAYLAVKDSSVAYFELGETYPASTPAELMDLDPKGFYHVIKNPYFRPSKKDSLWENEIAMQAGMQGGCNAYNDVMGYSEGEQALIDYEHEQIEQGWKDHIAWGSWEPYV